MSATYNWAYKPGVANKYGVVIASSADDVKPSNAAYVALFGNDLTGNGSREKPFRTLYHGSSVSVGNDYVIIASGVYRETDISNTIPGAFQERILVGDGDVTVDYSYYAQFCFCIGLLVRNIRFIGNNNAMSGSNGCACWCEDCVFDSCLPTVPAGLFSDRGETRCLLNCVIKNYTSPIVFNYGSLSEETVENVTLYNCSNVSFGGTQVIRSCIFKNCNVNFSQGSLYPQYSVFFQCNFSFNSGGGSGGALYPSVPAGYAYISDYPSLVTAFQAAYPATLTPLNRCQIADPKFSNDVIGDYSLGFDSPAKNASYFGTPVGANSIG